MRRALWFLLALPWALGPVDSRGDVTLRDSCEFLRALESIARVSLERTSDPGLRSELNAEIRGYRRRLQDAGCGGAESRAAPDVPFRDAFEAASRATGIPSSVLAAVARRESNFDPRAVSHAGARGLMQVRDIAVRDVGGSVPWPAFDPATNVLVGATYLGKMIARFGGDLRTALAAYNWGERSVRERPSPEDWPPGVVDYVEDILRIERSYRGERAG